ncbi:BQ2448_319 [Microbotryum intermedium]|uniref:BQ2448_319 protein n=1 Tax=Microbotryum intermedium TaxID=269621 RepID=A0A238FAP6_9BASI|nr:BQ2448_319 [Microbotryum intermedium]
MSSGGNGKVSDHATCAATPMCCSTPGCTPRSVKSTATAATRGPAQDEDAAKVVAASSTMRLANDSQGSYGVVPSPTVPGSNITSRTLRSKGNRPSRSAPSLNYAEMLIGIILCGKWPHYIRKGLWACFIVYSGSLLIASFAEQVRDTRLACRPRVTGADLEDSASRQLWTLMLFQGVLAGSAGGLLYAPIYVWLSQCFQARRALAGVSIFAGAGVGGFAFPLILNALLPPLGFRWTLRILALITLIICGLSVHLLQPRLPIVRPRPMSLPSSSLSPDQLQARQDHASASKISFSILYDPSFLLVSATVLTRGMIIATVSIFLLRVGDDFVKTLLFALLIGVSAGGFASTWFPSSIDVSICMGRRSDPSQSAVVFGYLAIVRGVASIVGPIIAGSVYEPTSVEGGDRMGRYGMQNFVVLIGILGMVALGLILGNESYRRGRGRIKLRTKKRGEEHQNGKELEVK